MTVHVKNTNKRYSKRSANQNDLHMENIQHEDVTLTIFRNTPLSFFQFFFLHYHCKILKKLMALRHVASFVVCIFQLIRTGKLLCLFTCCAGIYYTGF